MEDESFWAVKSTVYSHMKLLCYEGELSSEPAAERLCLLRIASHLTQLSSVWVESGL